MSRENIHTQSSSSRSRPKFRASRTTPELNTYPELWGTYVSRADRRQMDLWWRETREMVGGSPSSTRGQSVKGDNQASSSGRKRPRQDDDRSKSTKRARRSEPRDRASRDGASSEHAPRDHVSRKYAPRDHVSGDRGYAARPRDAFGHRAPYRANVFSWYSRTPATAARVYVNRNHSRFSHLYSSTQSSSSRSRPKFRASRTTPELNTYPELWGTYVSRADRRQMDLWRRETRELVGGSPSSTRGQSVRGDNQASSSGRKRPRQDDHLSSRSTKRARRSESRGRASRDRASREHAPRDHVSRKYAPRDHVSRDRGYAARPRDGFSHRAPYRANVFSWYSRTPATAARVYVNRNHSRFSHLYSR